MRELGIIFFCAVMAAALCITADLLLAKFMESKIDTDKAMIVTLELLAVGTLFASIFADEVFEFAKRFSNLVERRPDELHRSFFPSILQAFAVISISLIIYIGFTRVISKF